MLDYATAIKVTELYIGRKLIVSSGDIRLVVKPEITDIRLGDYNEPLVTEIASQSYQVFVDGKLYASIDVHPKYPRLHSPIRLTKDIKTGVMRLQLVKKYMEIM